MTPYREPAREECAHQWAVYWRPFASGVSCVACQLCGARAAGWRYAAWVLGAWNPPVHIMGRPPEVRR